MIQFKNVYKSFGPKRVLSDLNLSVQRGQIFFILGKSGTGKSVALKTLVGLLRPDSGEITLDGERIDQKSELEFLEIRKKCGIVFQLPALLDSRNLFENCCFGVRHLPMKQQIARCEKILPEVGLETLLPVLVQKYPPQLSYGEQKRLAIARTLIINPDYILFDEPTTGLDPETSRIIHELIRSISTHLNKTSIVVSHDMKNALQTANYLAVLDAGRVIAEGTPQVLAASQVPLVRDFLRDLRAPA